MAQKAENTIISIYVNYRIIFCGHNDVKFIHSIYIGQLN